MSQPPDAHALFAAAEEERRRIARELHDDTVQRLSGLSRQIESHLNGRDDPLLRQLKDEINAVLADLRRIIQDLRPPVLDDLGLLPALRSLAKATEDVSVDVTLSGEELRLAADTELALYRIAQEALNNVRKHAGATRARISLEFSPDHARLVVSDNGRGFQPPADTGFPARATRFGLAGMHERARLVGGTLKITSTPGQGTMVTADVPRQR